jgi:hypothetical protein
LGVVEDMRGGGVQHKSPPFEQQSYSIQSLAYIAAHFPKSARHYFSGGDAKTRRLGTFLALFYSIGRFGARHRGAAATLCSRSL